MAAFVIRHQLLSLLREGRALLLETDLDPVDCIIYFFLRDLFLLLSGTENSCLVEHVGEVGAGHTEASLGDFFQVD